MPPALRPHPFIPVSPFSVDHVIPEPGSSLMEAYDQWRQWADEKACCDYSLHVDITHWNDSVRQEVDHLIKEKGTVRCEADVQQTTHVILAQNVPDELCLFHSVAGVNSFQVYMAYKDYFQMSNSEVGRNVMMLIQDVLQPSLLYFETC